jgi:hypothetical protein
VSRTRNRRRAGDSGLLSLCCCDPHMLPSPDSEALPHLPDGILTLSYQPSPTHRQDPWA